MANPPRRSPRDMPDRSEADDRGTETATPDVAPTGSLDEQPDSVARAAAALADSAETAARQGHELAESLRTAAYQGENVVVRALEVLADAASGAARSQQEAVARAAAALADFAQAVATQCLELGEGVHNAADLGQTAVAQAFEAFADASRANTRATEEMARQTAEKLGDASRIAVQQGEKALASSMQAIAPTETAARVGAAYRETSERSIRTTIDQTEGLMSLSQGTVDAVLTSGQVWTAGIQDLARQIAASAQASLDETVASFKDMTSANSPQEVLEIQSRLASSALQKTLIDTGRIGNASIRLFEQTLAPLAARVSLAVGKFAKPGF